LIAGSALTWAVSLGIGFGTKRHGFRVQAGLEHNKRARAITTALGYNQLLATTVEILAESGHQFLKSLLTCAAALPVTCARRA